MAATRIVEEESGTFLGTPRNAHQGYYAGDFSRRTTTPNGFATAVTYAPDHRAYAPARGSS